MRVTTAFNRILDLPGASVASVEFTAHGLVLGLRRRRRLLRCPCGRATRARYDASRRWWRHLDFGATRVFVAAEVYRIACRACRRVRTEQVPWARPRSRFTRDFEDLTGWLTQRADKTTVSRLLRCSWEAVDAIAKRLVSEHIDDSRLDHLYRIGVDEISYKRGHSYLTLVADHDTGHVVWVTPGRDKTSFASFFTALGPQRTAQLEAITLDGSSIYAPVAATHASHAAVCIDPFHVIKWCNEALDACYRSGPGPAQVKNSKGIWTNQAWRRTRTALRTGKEHLDHGQRALIGELRRHRWQMFRAWELKEQLRALYRTVAPHAATDYLKRWCTRALRARIPAYRNLVTRIRRHLHAITAAVELGLSNSRLEGINAKIRVIQRRGYGHPDPASLQAMIYLCLGGIDLKLPTQR